MNYYSHSRIGRLEPGIDYQSDKSSPDAERYVSPTTGLTVKSCQIKRNGKYIKQGATLNFDSHGQLVSKHFFANDVETSSPATRPVTDATTLHRTDLVAIGSLGTILVGKNHTVWGWAAKKYSNQAGLAPMTPRQLNLGFVPIKLAATVSSFLALKNNGTVWGQGLNNAGQLGNGQSG